jgi:hypothetical protein
MVLVTNYGAAPVDDPFRRDSGNWKVDARSIVLMFFAVMVVVAGIFSFRHAPKACMNFAIHPQ